MSIRADVCPRPEAARQAALLLLISLGGAPAVLAQSPAPAPAASPAPSESSVPPDAALESNGAVIGDVVLRVGDVFDPSDPKENHLLFRLANKLHRNTRDEVIEQQLLFRPGDRYSRHLLDESERLLRQNRYLNDVKIRPVHYDDGRVDLEVVTRDVWTLNVGAGLGRSGGLPARPFRGSRGLRGAGRAPRGPDAGVPLDRLGFDRGQVRSGPGRGPDRTDRGLPSRQPPPRAPRLV
ncbi:MAG TPA: POTRA domain-containing protein, partial [Thermoanaerobaculia bacterium]|nr:POTRA domain-containing protein [Thermoanaerobaculia bacterium]